MLLFFKRLDLNKGEVVVPLLTLNTVHAEVNIFDPDSFLTSSIFIIVGEVKFRTTEVLW